jgi:signal transduction histidine kinase
LTAIVTRTLDFYRPSRGVAVPTQVNDVVESVLALAGKKLQHSKVKVQRKLAPDLPPIQAVTDQITQVFLNLVINAAEAMAPAGGELTISSICEDNWIRVGFSDTGPGIAVEEADKIFEPFYTTKATGTGLGLSISYGIIQRHGGRLKVNRVSGKGAIFIVEFPISS